MDDKTIRKNDLGLDTLSAYRQLKTITKQLSCFTFSNVLSYVGSRAFMKVELTSEFDLILVCMRMISVRLA